MLAEKILIGEALANRPINVSLLDNCLERRIGVEVKIVTELGGELCGRFLPEKWGNDFGLISLGYVGTFADAAGKTTREAVLLYTPSKTENWELYLPK